MFNLLCRSLKRSMFPSTRNLNLYQKVNGSVSSFFGREDTEKADASNWESRENASYEDAIETLLSLTSNANAINQAVKSKRVHAERSIPKMRKYLQRTGLAPDDVNKLSVIHVSGTKGKGSTCAFSERILSCHGYTTGLFTSPHLFEVRERIRINGRPISKALFCEYFWSIYTKLKETEISSRAEEGYDMPFFFNFLTVMSLHVFVHEEVDVAIMEVGIGGEYDSTNVIDMPVVCGMTALGLEHTNMLGNTIEEIAWNKAGIFKKDRPAIIVPQEPKALQVILDKSRERESPLFISQKLSKQELGDLNIQLGIDGDQQAENACLAVQLTDFWMRLHKTRSDRSQYSTLPPTCSIENIPKLKVRNLQGASAEGLSTCVWHGRTQTIIRERTTYYIDGAHTKESLEVCAQWYKQKAYKEQLTKRGSVVRILIFNSTGDRDAGLFLSILKVNKQRKKMSPAMLLLHSCYDNPLMSSFQQCNFDVALFCTNQLSTLESLNKADRHHYVTSPKRMMDKAMTNKHLWDQINLSSQTYAPKDKATSAESRESKEDGTELESEHDQTFQLKTKNSVARNGEEEMSPVPSSLAFPCILHALAWATQGRDPNVHIKDHRGVSLPEAPTFLKEAGHVQILITGSLHLVGGALEALTPDMNR